MADDAEKLRFDIEGRPLTARFVVGRTHAGGDDTGIQPEAYDALVEALTGSHLQTARRVGEQQPAANGDATAPDASSSTKDRR